MVSTDDNKTMGWQHIHDAMPIAMLCTVLWICCRCIVEKTTRYNVVNTTQIVCVVKLRRRLATLLNVARDSQNILSTWSHMLKEVVQTYDVEMACQRSIYTISVTNNDLGPEVQALHIAMWLKINIITCCIVDFQDSTTNSRKKIKYT